MKNIAAVNGNNNIIEFLLENGADIEIKRNNGETLLIAASGYDDQLETVKLLVQRGADIQVKDNNGNTALFYALDYGVDDIARFLEEQEES